MWTLYYAPETISLATAIALEEAGQPYDAVHLSIAARDHHRPDYLALNPKGRVPTLVTPKGALTETPAILVYIARAIPAAGLAPVEDAFQMARIEECLSYIAATLHVAHAHRMRGHRWVDDPAAIAAMQAKVPETVTAAFRHVEETYLAGDFVIGDSFTVADAHLFTVSRWVQADGVDPAVVPKVMAHRQRMARRPAVARALDRLAAPA